MAKVIDANTGIVMYEGMTFENVDGIVHVFELHVGLLSGWAVVSINGGPGQRVPLIVRWTHPSFFLRRVAFFPS